MRRVIFFCLFFGSITGVRAQSVSGRILGAGDESLPYASVAVKAVKDSSIVKIGMTDLEGNYTIDLEQGEYFLFAQTFSYRNHRSKPFKIDIEDVSFEDIKMEEDITELDAVVIKSQKPLIQKTARGLTVNMEASPIMSSGSTRDALTKIPGVVVNQDGTVSLKGRSNVVIYMDGKRTYMSLQQLVSYLEGLPASDIEKIEVFDTPPAKYDAEGDAGIINIVLKKGVALGFNGMVGANLGYGHYHKFSPWGNFNYRRPKFNFYGSGWYFDRPTKQHFDSRTQLDSALIEFNTDTKIEPQGGGGRIGLDWFINKKQTIGFLALGYNGIWAGVSNSVNTVGAEKVYTNNDRRFPWWGHGYNFNWTKDIREGEKLSFDADLIKQGSTQRQLVESDYQSNGIIDGKEYITTTGARNNTIIAAKVDYEKDLKGIWGLETGGKASQVRSEYDQLGKSGNELNVLNVDSNNTSQFNYIENIYASYFVITGSKEKKWDVDLGFRLEYTDIEGESETLLAGFKRGYLTLFPNMGMNYRVSDKSDISLSYTKRIGRPRYWQITPYIVKISEYNYEIGNPSLRPQNTNVYSVGYSWDKTVFATLSFNHVTNNMTYITDLDEETGITYNYMTNLNNIYNYSLNFVVPVPIKKWWKMNINLTTFYNHQSSDFKELGIDNKLVSYMLNIQNYIDLPNKYKVELRGFYNGKNYWMTQLKEPMYQMSVGISKEFKKFNLGLTYQDPFNWNESRGIINQRGLEADFYWKDESRLLKANFSYKFGNSKVKASRKRESASEDLQKR